MSDRYVHTAPERITAQDHDNLVTLGRHLALNAQAIADAGGLVFGHVDMTGFDPQPAQIERIVPLPPLAHGPFAGIRAEPGDDWPSYLKRCFGLTMGSPFMHWLQSDLWAKTEPTPVGAALRIGYALDYGVPHNHVEIALGQAHTDYDSNGFVWEKLKLPLFTYEFPSLAPTKIWPKWIGAVEQNRLRVGVLYNAQNLVPNLHENAIALPGEIKGCKPDEVESLSRRFGPLPKSYRDFLMLVGHKSGRLVDRKMMVIHAEDLGQIDRRSRVRIFQNARAEDDPVPKDAIFIAAQREEAFWFILSGNREDSPVFRFDAATGKVTSAGVSLWAWVQTLVTTPSDHRLRPAERERVETLKSLAADMQSRLAEPQARADEGRKSSRLWTALAIAMLVLAAVVTVIALS